MAGAGADDKAAVIERASIGDAYLREGYRRWQDGGREESSPEMELAYAYFRYLVKRLVDQFVLSGANDVVSQTAVLNTVVQLAFRVLIAGNKAEVKAADEIQSTGRLRASQAAHGPGGALLGRRGKCELGKSLLLGDGAAEVTPRIDVTVGLTAAQYKQLRARPDVLREIMDGFESAVPVHIDYRLYFSVILPDRTFRLLPRGAESLASVDDLPLLGITTALGAG